MMDLLMSIAYLWYNSFKHIVLLVFFIMRNIAKFTTTICLIYSSAFPQVLSHISPLFLCICKKQVHAAQTIAAQTS